VFQWSENTSTKFHLGETIGFLQTKEFDFHDCLYLENVTPKVFGYQPLNI
jgi:hypothetical protein